MIVIAVLLLAAVAAVAAGVIAGAQDDAVFDIFDETINVSGLEVFAVGAACGLAVAVALWMALIGARQNTARRRQMRAIRADRDREHAELAREREQLEAERERLHASRSDGDTDPARPRGPFAGLRKRHAARTDEDEHGTADQPTR